jgi:hypothetical protein
MAKRDMGTRTMTNSEIQHRTCLRPSFRSADAAEPANLGGPSESVDHGDSELVLKQLHTLRTKPGADALAAPISARWCRCGGSSSATA